MKLVLLVLILAFLQAIAEEPKPLKQAYLVYPAKCLQLDPKSKVEVPWINGTPDYKKAKTDGIIDYNRDCQFAYTAFK